MTSDQANLLQEDISTPLTVQVKLVTNGFIYRSDCVNKYIDGIL